MAASNYAACISKVLRYEGGYINDPHDPGGETNYGITIAVARANGYTGAMRNIPMDLVRKIYRTKYWDVVNGDSLPAGIDLCVFDYAVNSGPARAKALQLGGGSPQAQIERYCNARLAFLQRLKTWPRYGKGWSSRVADVRATAIKMASAPVPAPKPAADAGKVGGGAAAGGAVVVGTGAAVEAGWSPTEIGLLVAGLIALAVGGYFAWRWWNSRQIPATDSAVAVDESEPQPAPAQPTKAQAAVARAVSRRGAAKGKRKPAKAAKKRRA